MSEVLDLAKTHQAYVNAVDEYNKEPNSLTLAFLKLKAGLLAIKQRDYGITLESNLDNWSNVVLMPTK